MKIYRNVGLNFLGAAWNGFLIAATTPWYLSLLGYEQFGLVAFWQLLLAVVLVFDFGLGATLTRELARYRGAHEPRKAYLSILILVERICLPIAFAAGSSLLVLSNLVATSWLKLISLPMEVAESAISWMSLSVATQLMSALYLNGLAGMQRHSRMNLIQVVGNTLKYLGGGLILSAGCNLIIFFAFQGFCLLGICFAARAALYVSVPNDIVLDKNDKGSNWRQLWPFSISMFVTALLGMILNNADRILVSKMLSTEDLGRYSVSLIAAGFIQMVVLAFYRVYYPLFAELFAKGDSEALEKTFQTACQLVGAFVLPASTLGWVFAPELILFWLGRNEPDAAYLLRWLVVGGALAGLMWLPAAYQQACGWPALHIRLMILSLAIGVPLAVALIHFAGAVGGAAIMVAHGLIEISLGLLLMYQTYFSTSVFQWYRFVVLKPLLVAIPLAVLPKYWMPEQIDRLGSGLWLTAAFIFVSTGMIIQNRKAFRIERRRLP